MPGLSSQRLGARNHPIDAMYHASSAVERGLLALGFAVNYRSRFRHFEDFIGVMQTSNRETRGIVFEKVLAYVGEPECDPEKSPQTEGLWSVLGEKVPRSGDDMHPAIPAVLARHVSVPLV